MPKADRAAARRGVWMLALWVAAGACAGRSPEAKAPDPAQSEPADPSERAGSEAARAWLALVDAAEYGESWTSTAPLFKKRVSQGQWESAMQTVRGPLGPVQSRQVRSHERKGILPRAPEGNYVLVQFETDFEHKRGAVETVTTAQQRDGTWQVVGYFVK